MIYGSSNHPVLIKKINLKIWTLRDEIESIIQNRIDQSSAETLDLSDLVADYKKKELVTEAPLKLIDGAKAEVDAGEDEMLKAMQEAESDEPKPIEEIESEASTATPLEKSVQVLRRVPTLPAEKIYSGKMLLSEIDMQMIYFFGEQKFAEGQSIVLDFQIPMRFVMNADILYCRPYNMKSRIISANRLPYRIAARFTFLKEGERTLLRNFINSIEVDIEEVAVIKKPKATESTESFEDLDDFDL